MMISHSIGTIIAYDALRNLGRDQQDLTVKQFVTMGSPLGLTPVRARVYRGREYSRIPVRTPSIVTERWVNYSDRKDRVAAESHLRGDYRSNDNGIRVADNLIHNDSLALDEERNPHKSVGYLRTPEISDQIKDFLGA
jgi:hypothetical protein